MEDNQLTESGQEPVVSDVLAWIEKLIASNRITKAKGGNWRSRLFTLSKYIADDEPRSVAWVLANVDDLADRYANDTGREHGRVYASQARAAMTEFMEARRLGAAWKPKKATAAKGSAKKSKPAKPSAVDKRETDVAAAPSGRVAESTRFVLGQDRVFEWRSDELRKADLGRLFINIASTVPDMSPSDLAALIKALPGAADGDGLVRR